MPSVYQVNKGINKSIEFKGLKAQYIWYLGAGLVAALLIYAILYVLHVNCYLCIIIAFGIGGSSIGVAYKLSNKYGEHGLMKRMARRSVPGVLKSYSRKVFKREKL